MYYEQPIMIGLFGISVVMVYLGSVQKDHLWYIKFLLYAGSFLMTLFITYMARVFAVANTAPLGVLRILDGVLFALIFFLITMLGLFGVFFYKTGLELKEEKRAEKYD